MVTATGVTIEHEIEAAALTPEADGSTIAIYALLGIYIGVIPVAIGLFWYPSLRRASRRWIGFFLAFTVGLLGFLLIDTVAEGFELAGETPAALDGLSLFALGAVGAVAALAAFERFLEHRRATQSAEQRGPSPIVGLVLAYLIAGGIGLHNLGEGLAVGAALAGGEVALGTFLILGFAIHNTTEGLAIVAPLGSETKRPSLRHFVALGALGRRAHNPGRLDRRLCIRAGVGSARVRRGSRSDRTGGVADNERHVARLRACLGTWCRGPHGRASLYVHHRTTDRLSASTS